MRFRGEAIFYMILRLLRFTKQYRIQTIWISITIRRHELDWQTWMLWNDVKILWLWIIQIAFYQFQYCAKFLTRTASHQDIQEFLTKAISHGTINVWMGRYLVSLFDTIHMFWKRILLCKILHRDLTKEVFLHLCAWGMMQLMRWNWDTWIAGWKNISNSLWCLLATPYFLENMP